MSLNCLLSVVVLCLIYRSLEDNAFDDLVIRPKLVSSFGLELITF